ncbi:RES family NAD+ phosphorylase [Rhodanobacter soli]
MEQRICEDHVVDRELKNAILRSDTRDQPCDYCDQTKPTLRLWELAQLFEQMIDQFYDPTSGYDDYGNSIEEPSGDPLSDVVEREGGLTGQALDDIVECLAEMWFDRDTMECKYGDDPHFVEGTRFGEALDRDWLAMEESLRHDARIVNPMAFATLRRVFGHLAHDQPLSDGSEGAIAEVGPGTALDRLYRARVFLTLGELEVAMQLPEKFIGPPAPGIGGFGRMNAKGISVFYGSIEPLIAIAEVRPPVGSHVVVAGFKITKRLRLLDFTRLGPVRLGESKFDRLTAERYERSAFLGKLRSRLVMPVMPGEEEDGYLITQAVADYLSTDEALKLDGIMFPSVQHEEREAVGNNVILFRKAALVSGADRGAGNWSSFNLWEYDDIYEGTYKLEPTLATQEVELDARYNNKGIGHTASSLELDRDDVTIRLIKGVSFTTTRIPVMHKRIVAKQTQH